MRIWLAILGFIGCLMPGMALAQAVPVRSGEHPGFTRLVARIGAERDWQITRDADTLHIRFTPDAPAFDTSRVFDLIGRDRLVAIRSEDGLVLELNCACTVTIERYDSRFAVIDIDDTPFSPPDPPAPTETASAPGPDPTPTPQGEAAVELPLFIGRRSGPELPGLATATTVLPTDGGAAPPPARVDIEEAGHALAEQLARATAAGLLDVAPGESFESGEPVPDPPPARQEAMPEATPDPHSDPVAPQSPPLDMANAFDLRQEERADRLSPQAAAHCIAAPDRPAAQWSDGMDFSNGVGALRVGLYDDRGQLVPDTALLLAEFYLYHGFGAEAAFWIDQLQAAHPFHSGLARYLEHGTHGDLGRFGHNADCPDSMLFWQFLTGPGQTRPDDAQTIRILADYYALPPTLRDLFGPTLARNFVQLGDQSAAMEVRATLRRGGRIAPDALTLLDLDLAEAAPEMATLEATPATPPAHVSSVNAATAMTHRLRAQITAQGYADAADLLAAEALIFETDPDPDLNGLVHVTALAHALAGNLDPIMQHLNATMVRDVSAAMPIFTDVVDILMDQEQTAQLLILLSSPEFGQFGHFPSPAYRRSVAQYFLDHGMPDLARDIIMAGGSDRTPDRALLDAAFARLSRDLSVPDSDLPTPAEGALPIAPADSAEAIAALLDQSRATRAAISDLLNSAGPGS